MALFKSLIDKDGINHNAVENDKDSSASFINSLVSELRFIRQDRWLKALLIWLPIVLMAFLLSIFSAGLASNLPVGIVDNDHSVMSRSLVRYYDASATLEVKYSYASVSEASNALRSNSIYAVAIIPKDLEKKTLLGESPQVTVFYNSQFILIGKLINAAFLKAQGTYVASLETFKNLISTKGELDQAIGEAVPISTQITPLFNKNNHYGQFLVSAGVPAMWQILIVATIVLSFSIKHHAFSRKKNARLSNWLSGFTAQSIVIKLLPYVFIFWAQGLLFLLVFYYVLGWPMQGSWLTLIFAQLLLVIACASMATLFFFIAIDGARSMSLVAGITAPAFAFMGVTFPTSDMPLLAQVWRAFLPISHYIEVQGNEVNYGANFITNVPHFLMLISFVSYFFIALWFIKTHQKKALSVEQADADKVFL